MNKSIPLNELRKQFSYSEIVDGVHLAPEKAEPLQLCENFEGRAEFEARLNPEPRESVQEMVDRGVSRVEICCNGTLGL